ncbi:MAG TPA: hypothetical protein VH107_16960 [Lacipirellulaceae bacterium]|jgi:hypothetical protein|nr:hypothetical protein [Lacipirellulaceae bacterium]
MNRSDFLAHFVWRCQNDFSYLPPAEGAVEQVLAAAIDGVDFDTYRSQFEAFFALITKAATEGLWGGELKKNPLLTGLANLPSEERAKHVVVAVQVLSWLHEIQAWSQDRLPRCQIARIAACWTIHLIGKFKGYPPEQLTALVRASAGFASMDASEMSARSKVLRILASHAKELPRDADTRAALDKFLENVQQDKALSQADQKAVEKLSVIVSGEESAPKKTAANEKSKPKPAQKKAIRESDLFWELPAESELRAAITPDPPQPKKHATVRLTHANPYGPFDGARLFVRIGDLENPTDQSDENSVTDWIACALVEELVHVDGREIPRAEAKATFTDEVPWTGTYEAQLKVPTDACSIEIKVISEHPEVPYFIVLSDWSLNPE